MAETTCGTPGYVAPEVLIEAPYDHRCDYWSLGVLMFIMLSGAPPFYHEDNFELFELIKQGKYDFDAPIWK
jgi:serine/threonine protein kinase